MTRPLLSPALFLTIDTLDDMEMYLDGLISAFPEENVSESVSEWAERKRTLSGGLAAIPGRYDYDNAPYLREIADCLSVLSPVQEVYVMKATQVGFTVGVYENHIGYCIEYSIGPLLYISGDQAMAEEQMEKRVDEMIYSAGLQEKIRANITKKKGKSTGDRMDSKSYGGTFMRAVGPNSESKLRSFPNRCLHEDEIDIYPQNIVKGGTSTGNPLEKAERRTDSYGNLRKICGGSTPKQKSTSQIEPKCEEGDKRYYNFTCPDCGIQQPLVWAQLKWDKNQEGKPDIQYRIINGVETIEKNPVYYECVNCGRKILEHEKRELLLEKGRGGTAEWIPTKKPSRPFVRSYHINALYGFRSWIDIVLQWEKVKDDPLLLPDFINDVLGETWQERIDAPDIHELRKNAEGWERGYISDRVIFLTLAADVQGDRIEAGLVGWGRNKESWFIDYWNIPGSPHLVEDQCWKKLEEIVTATYRRADNVEMNVQIAFVDSQYHKDQVYNFCDQFDYHQESIAGVYPVLAREAIDAGKTTKIMKSDIKTPVVGLSDQKLKFALYGTLRKTPYAEGYPYGYMHFPRKGDQAFGEEFYKQLTSEEIFIETKKNGKQRITIENRKQRRNEVFDVAKYNIAAYQFAFDRYFEIENEKRKAQKLVEIQPDNDVFINEQEAALLYAA
ncbi:MAG: hypothetical protein CVV44_03940 [Spirochaetae bacterium HGW-Spirochaetae-1]|jgi:phage terminase large subunit GpA-like protein|nr:MAG: hypothetical protein CVV44_03940 [Spirochaetae bacterium HGW-Spirochaetae-1]